MSKLDLGGDINFCTFLFILIFFLNATLILIFWILFIMDIVNFY